MPEEGLEPPDTRIMSYSAWSASKALKRPSIALSRVHTERFNTTETGDVHFGGTATATPSASTRRSRRSSTWSATTCMRTSTVWASACGAASRPSAPRRACRCWRAATARCSSCASWRGRCARTTTSSATTGRCRPLPARARVARGLRDAREPRPQPHQRRAQRRRRRPLARSGPRSPARGARRRPLIRRPGRRAPARGR
jgi:hypothetical protein